MFARPIKVAYLLEQCWHRVPGGTAVAAVGLCESLNKRDDIELIGLAAKHNKEPSLRPPSGLPIVHSSLPRQVLYKSWAFLKSPSIDRLAACPDLVHASGGAIPATQLPLIATIHDLAWMHEPAWFPSRGRRFAQAWLKNSRNAKRIICPSKATFNDLVSVGFDPQKIQVIPLGVDHKEVSNEEVSMLRKKHDLQSPFVLWVGTVEPRKNLATLVDALLEIPDLILVLVGPTGWGVDLQKILEPVKERVRIIGQVDDKTKNIWLKAADVFCFPSLFEGFGLPVGEAMAHGTPVVTSATTATAEVVGDAGLLIDPKNPSEISDAISSILNDRDLASELSKKGQLRSKELSWESSAELTVSVYREVLES